MKKMFINSLLAKISPEVLKTYNTVENTILHYASYLQPLNEYRTICLTENLCFFATVYLKKILKFCNLEKNTKNLF